MSLTRTVFAGLAAAVALVALTPPALADPVWPVAGAQSAAATIRDLESQGYIVQINWVNGYSNADLNECTVNGINNPDRSGQPLPPENTTVYVDVQCPSHDWGWGGVGFGL